MNFRLHSTHLICFALTLTPLLFELPPLISTLLFTLAVAYFIRPVSHFLFTMRWPVQLLAALSGVFCYFYYQTLLSPDSASSLMCLVTAIKIFDCKTIRDQYIFFFMNLLIAMFYGLYAQNLFSTLYLFAVYFFFIFFLLDLNKRKLGLLQDPWSLKQLLTLETLVALPLLIFLFLFFPRFTTSWGGLGSTAETVSGFSNYLNPGQLQKVVQSDLVAFRVIMPAKKIPLAPNLYFRGRVLEKQIGWQWSEANPVNQFVVTPQFDDLQIDYEILLEPRFEKTLFTLEPTKKISLFPTHFLFTEKTNKTYELRWPLQNKIKLQGQLDANFKDLAPPQPFHLQVREKPTPQIQALLNELQKETSTDLSKLESLMSFYRRTQFQYSLSTPTYKNIDEFLFGPKIGFCEHFAASFATLARHMGLPSRVVIGFQGAEVNTYGSYLIVRDRYAHAWNEIYISSEGWVRVDPTALVAPSRIQQTTLAAGTTPTQNIGSQNWLLQASLFWDAINNRFTLMLMNYNIEDQYSLLEKWGLKSFQKKTLLYLVLAFAALIALFFWLLTRKDRVSQDLIAKAYHLLNQKLLEQKIVRAANEGPLDLIEKIKDSKLANKTEIVNLIKSYIALRFGTSSSSSDIKKLYNAAKDLRLQKQMKS
jgi:protein-glutamine gamma-glutamyltransferase